MIVVMGLYAIPGSDLQSMSFWQAMSLDKLGHLTCFAILSLTMAAGFRKQTFSRQLNAHPFRYAILLSVIYGGVLELIQGAVFVERHSDIFDFIANSLGAVFGIVIFRIIYGRELSRTKF
jgi:glycopeptide antibiotics resistance protein